MTNKIHIDTKTMISAEDIFDADPVENDLLRKRANHAKDYLLSFRWCRSVDRLWFAGGFSYVAVFLAKIDDVRYDKELWVIVGDLPPAHLVTDDIPDFKEALLSYVYHMRKWVAAAKNGKSVSRYIPVNVPPSKEYAEMLESRLNFIECEYIPSINSKK